MASDPCHDNTMCGRFHQQGFAQLIDFYDAFLGGGFSSAGIPGLGERFNIGPQQQVFTLRKLEDLADAFSA
ncbi:MAG: hypothetical protein RID07_10150, partial [Lacipirellulaceae bacterium]